MKKRMFFHFHLFQKRAAEDYFQKMAEKGWMLSDMNSYLITFTKCRPQTQYFVIGIDDHNGFRSSHYVDEETQDYRAFMEGFGFRFVCGYDKIQVFQSDEKEDIYSDEVLDRNMLRKAVLRQEWGSTFYPILLTFMVLLTVFPRYAYELASNGTLLYSVIFVFLFFTALMKSIPVFTYLVFGKEAEKGKAIERKGRITAIYIGLMGILTVCQMFFSGIQVLCILVCFFGMLILEEIFRKKNVPLGFSNGIGIAFLLLTVTLSSLFLEKGGNTSLGGQISESILLKSETFTDTGLDCLYIEIVTFKNLKEYCKASVIESGNMKRKGETEGAAVYEGNEDILDTTAVMLGDQMIICYVGDVQAEALLQYLKMAQT